MLFLKMGIVLVSLVW